MNTALLVDEDDYLVTQFRLEIFGHIRKLADRYQRWLQAEITGLENLHAKEREALRTIAISECIPMSQLASDLQLGLSATSTIITSLEELNLSFRERSLYDARSKAVYFESESQHAQALNAELASFGATLDWTFAALTTDEVETLLALLRKL